MIGRPTLADNQGSFKSLEQTGGPKSRSSEAGIGIGVSYFMSAVSRKKSLVEAELGLAISLESQSWEPQCLVRNHGFDRSQQ